MTTTASTRALVLPDANVAYDVREPAAPSEHRPVLIVGQPMCADGFAALADELTDRTVVTYDPRGLGRSTRSDGRRTNDPRIQAEDLHALVAELGRGPVDVFASSGGAVTCLALVEAHPEDIGVLIAHEPPIFSILPDAEPARAAAARGDRAYQERGFGAGMAAFIQLVSHRGEFTPEFLKQPLPEPAAFGLPAEDDGSRDDPLLSDQSKPITDYEPDIDALRAASTHIVVGVGETSADVLTGRAAAALAGQLDAPLVTFRGGHGGFMAEEWGQPGDPALFADQVRAALAGS